MGGERFDTPQPEAYLFGENADLNFLGSRPTPVRRFSNIYKGCQLPELFLGAKNVDQRK
jgi:hypothetical protein